MTDELPDTVLQAIEDRSKCWGAPSVARRMMREVAAIAIESSRLESRGVPEDGGITQALVQMARANAIEECAQAAENVVPRHTECGNKIARAIRAIDGEALPQSQGGPDGR